MSERKLRGFEFERLEDRRLLAADFGVEVVNCCCNMMPAETVMTSTMEAEDWVATSEIEESGILSIEVGSENRDVELNGDIIVEPDCEPDVQPVEIAIAAEESAPVTEGAELIETQAEVTVIDDLETESELEDCETGEQSIVEADVANEPGMADGDSELIETPGEAVGIVKLGPESEMVIPAANDVDIEMEAQVEADVEKPLASELLDPVHGTSGYFGEIDEIASTRTMSFTPSESGAVDVVVASSFGDSETRVEIVNSDGDLIANSMTENLDGFQKTTFNVLGNETYEVTVSSDESGEGYFMVTVEFRAETNSVPDDGHADEIGESATLLDMQNDTVAIQSDLETAEDRDAFRFVASADGEMVIDMAATSKDHQSDALVSVFDAQGDLLVSGATNEEVAVRFDAFSGVEYQVLVDSQNDVPTSFSVHGTLFANVDEESDPINGLVPADDTVSDDATGLDWEDELVVCEPNSEADENELVDEVFEKLVDESFAENDSFRNRFGGERQGFRFRRR